MTEHESTERYMPITSSTSGMLVNAAEGIHYLTVQIVNVCFVTISQDEWVLVDAGMPKSAKKIIEAAEELYGEGARPHAIILTHGHFDHVGAIFELIEEWNVPVYAHSLELPYLTGAKNYPEPDSTVEGGLIAKFSSMFPNEGINLETHIQPLPSDGSIIEMPGWKWIHTPGHTPGHISLYREKDGALIAGDAFVTVKQESLYKVLTQEQEISGPPRYLTTDWDSALNSVRTLEALKPSIAITGHGIPMAAGTLENSLLTLVRDFEQIAIPEHGKYVNDEN
ncbi:glyoxylase-like metal-dependent hydrolase (beta-lactamase superfamily II) [Cytobacillus horneckiae]|uniref:MBL fold metallo-hydrolase n=1 Tax=Cytobacillus horneckiae TaxID=549687 RepID=A0A2N0ZBV1_9BACI|nr:MBL fold metallo-hydrolase [Cytobacillus horneckiae]NRG45997.1 MBL fold metallo-hydrolase [Bacillus sp. CRN 9]MBN6886188.1 MBL fold metallo-hydrolase [Cytobacillus horneckiae]MCM3176487.1 MBL fold metallo-hydrolase [Cytobacillus horneckiae]MEC1158348.1 MBL fold metallo-hydrolase [Cytobacillus horneckiae]MED2937378.1 MBL fold metallo-hydrolase [Cytobacillus horneckiae]